MKRFTKLLFVTLALGCLGFSIPQTLNAQCAFNNDPWTVTTAPTSVGVSKTITTCAFGGEYVTLTGMVQGNTYQIATCGDQDFDTELTLWASTNTSLPLAYNDDFCGSQSQFDFSPSNTGDYYIQVNEAPGCGTRSTCMTITVTLTQAAPPPPVVCTSILSIPYNQDFESFATCGTSCGNVCPLTSGWENSSFDGMDWTVDVGGTSSSSTGPSADFNPGTSTGKYLYTETSGSGCTNTDAIMTTPCFVLAGALCPAASFAYHQFGATQGTLNFEISLDQGNSWLPLWSSTGDQGNQWNNALVDLGPYSGSLARFRFRAETGSSFTSDMAIDDFSLFDQAAGLNASFTGLPGTIAVNAGPVTLVGASPGGTFIGAGISGTTFDPAAAGVGTFIITYTVGSGICQQSSSQIVTVTPIVCGTVATLPYGEDFDSFSTCSASCGSACVLSNGWTNEVVGDGMDWTTDANGTTSSSTGPSGDHTSGSGNYLYTETSGTACNGATAIATSPCIDLGSAACPAASVWYHQFGAAQGTFNIDISTDNGNTWANIFSSTGDQGDQWNVALLDLSAYSGIIRLRMRGETGTTFTSDMAFDDVSVFDFTGADASFAGLSSTACTSDGVATLVPVTPGGTFSGPGVTGNEFDAAAAGAGTHTITYSVGPAACAVTSSQTVTVLPPPTVTVTGNNETCAGDATTLTAASGSCPNGFSAIYNQSANQEITSTGQNMNFSFGGAQAPTGDATVTFRVRGDFGLSSETATLIDENGNTLGVNQGQGTTDCNVNYGVLTFTIPQSTVAAWAADGQIDFVVDLSSSVNVLCTNEDVDLSINYAFGAATGCTIAWSDDNGNGLGSTASITVSPTATTTYSATVTDANGCVTTEDYTVTVNPLPFVDAGMDQTICDGETATLTVNGGTGMGNNSLQTTFADNNGAGGNMFDVVASTTVQITGFDMNISSATADIEVYYKAGGYAGFENNASAWTSAGSVSGVISNGRGNPTPINLPIAVNIPAGQTYSFYLQATSGSVAYTNGTTEGAIFVQDGNIAVLEGVGRSTGTAFSGSIFRPRVVNANVYYNVGGSGPAGSTYVWSTGATTQTIDVTPGVGANAYTVTLTDANSCSNVDTVVVNVNPNPSYTATVQDVSCFGGSDGAIDLNIAGQTLGSPYNQSLPFQSLTTTGQALTFTFTGAGTATGDGTLTVSVQGDIDLSSEFYEIFDESNGLIGQTATGGSFAFQCDSVITTTFTIPVANLNAMAADGNIVLVADASASVNSFCATEGVEMTLSYPGGPAFTVAWTGPGGFTSSMEDISGLVAGDYDVTVTDAQTGCTTSSTITVSEPPLLVADAGACGVVFPGYNGGGADLCETLSGSATGGTPPYSYSWSSGDNSQASTVCPTITTLYTVTVTDANGCTATDTVRVFAYDVNANCATPGNPDKVEICHVPPGNPGNAHTICVDNRAAEAHLVGSASGGHDNCYLGPCGYDPCAGSAKAGLPGEGVAFEMQVSAYPNPFSTSTTIQFSASASQNVMLEVFTLKGEKVATLFEGQIEARVNNSVKFYASDLSDGIYMYKMTTENGDVFIDKLVINR